MEAGRPFGDVNRAWLEGMTGVGHMRQVFRIVDVKAVPGTDEDEQRPAYQQHRFLDVRIDLAVWPARGASRDMTVKLAGADHTVIADRPAEQCLAVEMRRHLDLDGVPSVAKRGMNVIAPCSAAQGMSHREPRYVVHVRALQRFIDTREGVRVKRGADEFLKLRHGAGACRPRHPNGFGTHRCHGAVRMVERDREVVHAIDDLGAGGALCRIKDHRAVQR